MGLVKNSWHGIKYGVPGIPKIELKLEGRPMRRPFFMVQGYTSASR